jgi:uncharacterized SAM-binding protein YcdF (DUF218 family)
MLFELSKLLSFFLVPSNIMVILGLAGITLLAIGYARAGRWLLIVSIVLIAAVGSLPTGRGLAMPLEERFPSWDGPPAGVIVLGGGVIKSVCSSRRDFHWRYSRSDNRGRRPNAPLSKYPCGVRG